MSEAVITLLCTNIGTDSYSPASRYALLCVGYVKNLWMSTLLELDGNIN